MGEVVRRVDRIIAHERPAAVLWRDRLLDKEEPGSFLRPGTVVLIVRRLEDDTVRVNLIPRKRRSSLDTTVVVQDRSPARSAIDSMWRMEGEINDMTPGRLKIKTAAQEGSDHCEYCLSQNFAGAGWPVADRRSRPPRTLKNTKSWDSQVLSAGRSNQNEQDRLAKPDWGRRFCAALSKSSFGSL